MKQKTGHRKASAEKVIKDIRRVTRKQYSAEEKIRIVLEGLRGEETIAALCRREGIAESLYYNWSKEFLEAGKKRLAGDTARAAPDGPVGAVGDRSTIALAGPQQRSQMLRPAQRKNRRWLSPHHLSPDRRAHDFRARQRSSA